MDDAQRQAMSGAYEACQRAIGRRDAGSAWAHWREARTALSGIEDTDWPLRLWNLRERLEMQLGPDPNGQLLPVETGVEHLFCGDWEG